MTIDPDESDAALARDRVTAEAPAGATKTRQDEVDRRALERAENEGMTARPV